MVIFNFPNPSYVMHAVGVSYQLRIKAPSPAMILVSSPGHFYLIEQKERAPLEKIRPGNKATIIQTNFRVSLYYCKIV